MRKMVSGLVIIFISIFAILPASDSLAQTEQTELFQDGKYERQRGEYLFDLEQYYRNKTPEEIWRDYLNCDIEIARISRRELVSKAWEFREPFLSWAVEEILKQGLSPHQLSGFLSTKKYSKEAKDKALESFLNHQSQQIPQLLFEVPHLESIIEVVAGLFNDLIMHEKFAASDYIIILIDRILQDPGIFYVPNKRLESMLRAGSPEQKSRIVQIIFNNNPDEGDLHVIIDAGINLWSDIARGMLEEKKIQRNAEILDSYLLYIKTVFLEKKMKRWPN